MSTAHKNPDDEQVLRYQQIQSRIAAANKELGDNKLHYAYAVSEREKVKAQVLAAHKTDDIEELRSMVKSTRAKNEQSLQKAESELANVEKILQEVQDLLAGRKQ